MALGMSVQWAAAQFIRMKQFFSLLPESADALIEWERLVAQRQVSGKKTHDAHLVAVMNVNRVTHILTFNGEDFTRYPGISVIQPQDFRPTQESR
jgi:predicted nucleic acid-binding protein